MHHLRKRSQSFKMSGPNLYVVSARKPDSVSHVLRANFTAPSHINVIVSKTTHLEIYVLESAANGSKEKYLRLVLDAPIYGRIATLGKCRMLNRSQDTLVISTERHRFMVISYNASQLRLETEIVDDISELLASPTDNPHIGLVQPDGEFAAFHNYRGSLKVIEIAKHCTGSKPHKKTSRDLRRPMVPINFRLEEHYVLSLAFMEAPPGVDAKPLLAVLYQDHRSSRHLKIYTANFVSGRLQEFKGLGAQNLDYGANTLIPIPRASGSGVIVISEQNITAVTPKGNKSITIRPTIMKCWDRFDPEGTRYLLGDYEGKLYALILIMANDAVVDVRLEDLGQVTQASAVAYLDAGYVYVGSHFGDSQLVQLSTQPNERYEYVDIKMEFENLAPIIDFCVVDIEKQGQSQVVAACGGNKDGSLRVIRNGIGIEVLGTLNDVPDLNGIWALKPSFDAPLDDTLVLSFISETKLIGKDEDGDLGPIDDADAGDFILDQTTLACANVTGDQTVQVVPTGINLLASSSRSRLSTWTPPRNARIHHASINPQQIVLAMSGGFVVYLEVHQGALQQVSEIELEHEVSCINISPLQSVSPLRSDYCLVGLWTDMTVRLLELPSLKEFDKQITEQDMIPRSVLLVTMGGIDFAMAALGDGHLYTFQLHSTSRRFCERKSVSLGSRSISLSTFASQGSTCVFAASDRPTVMHMSNGKILYSPVNLKEVTHMCPFHYDEDALALVTGGALKIGLVEAIQKLHVKKIPLGETVRRIVHDENAGAFGILTLRTVRDQESEEEEEKGFVRILDDRTYEGLDEYALEPFENPQSIHLVNFGSQQFMCVGTAYVLPQEEDPAKGRILVFAITESRRLRLITETQVHGCVYCLSAVGGRLLAGVNSKVQTFALELKEDGATWSLTWKATHHGNIIVYALAVRGDFVLVGDLMKSVKVLQYNSQDDTLTKLAQDHDSVWITGLEAVDDDLYVAAEHNQNLVAFQKISEAVSESERDRLKQCGWFHVGQGVNRIRRGALTTNLVDQEHPIGKPVLIYCTVTGGLGVIASVDDKTYGILSDVQENMRLIVRGVGELRHDQWRATADMRGPERPSTGFLDGDLIEQYLDLTREHKEAVIKGTRSTGDGPQHESKRMKKLDVTVEELVHIVEEMTRLH
ncbi:UV-damaged DNA-binding protein 1A [Powellomyces hirtus]|nr:UV-damaged DNA-binding protein 1A [Powellomyces hirtus]